VTDRGQSGGIDEDRPGIAYAILGPIAAANIDVDMIVQNIWPAGPPRRPGRRSASLEPHDPEPRRGGRVAGREPEVGGGIVRPAEHDQVQAGASQEGA